MKGRSVQLLETVFGSTIYISLHTAAYILYTFQLAVVTVPSYKVNLNPLSISLDKCCSIASIYLLCAPSPSCAPDNKYTLYNVYLK